MAFERLEPGKIEWDLYMGNHIVRYKFAKMKLNNIPQLRVLDAATGVGYGSILLSEISAEIVAVDRDEHSLSIGKTHFNRPNIKFINDDCETLLKVDGLFDAIVSFETLEHLPNPQNFLSRCNELLSEDGMIIISTPNQLVSGFETKTDWEFHEKEYTPRELIEILQKCGFKNIELYGQFYSEIGILRNQFRSELQRLHSNPFIRLGKKIQKILRGIKERALLPEMEVDFIIEKISENKTNKEIVGDPFVLIAVARK